MNGANRYTAPIERSIPPLTIRKTSPAARIATGAKYGSSVLKLSIVAKRSDFSVKYSAVASLMTVNVPSRSVRDRRPSDQAPPARARVRSGPCLAGAVSGWGCWPAWTATSAQLFVTPTADVLPSNRDLVLLYGTTVSLSRNLRPVL